MAPLAGAVSAREAFGRLAGAALPDWPQAERSLVQRRLGAGEVLFLTGQAVPHVYVVNHGVIKMVYETPAGNAWIKGFAVAGVCFASLTALQPRGATSFSAYAEGPTQVEQIEYASLQQLAARHPLWQLAVSNAYKLYGQRKEQREMELLTLTPQERYLEFTRHHPALCAQLRQSDIASYVRVTPVALSRIKARLKAQGLIT